MSSSRDISNDPAQAAAGCLLDEAVGRHGGNVRLTPLKMKIIDALTSSKNGRMHYHDLARKLWPPDKHPRAWNYSSNGGPHAWCMPLGRALRELHTAGIAQENYPKNGGAGHGEVVLIGE
jgi:hypothetical protein